MSDTVVRVRREAEEKRDWFTDHAEASTWAQEVAVRFATADTITVRIEATWVRMNYGASRERYWGAEVYALWEGREPLPSPTEGTPT